MNTYLPTTSTNSSGELPTFSSIIHPIIPIKPILPIIPIHLPTNTPAWQCGAETNEIGCTGTGTQGHCVWVGSGLFTGICKNK
jgi:hypothetical protein